MIARASSRVVFVVMLAIIAPTAAQNQVIRVGSKSFTESVILGEIAAQLARSSGFEVEHVEGLGGTRIVWEALLAGNIDVYAEYTGTISQEILSSENLVGPDAIRAHLATLGLKMTLPLGFNNTYALGMKEDTAARLNIRTISDLRDHAGLKLRFSNEFMQRGDGWIPLAKKYRLPHADVRGLEHALAYEAIGKGVIDVTDLYATDAKIRKLGLRALHDDLSHFPVYHAVYVYREELEKRASQFVRSLRALEGAISEADMIEMNAGVELDGRSDGLVASGFLAETFQITSDVRSESVVSKIWGYTCEHLEMVVVSLLAATVVGIPLGVWAAKSVTFAQPILGVVGMIQTIPSIALLVLLIRPIGYITGQLGYPQAVVALFLYSLLPIVRNTFTGLRGIEPHLQESATALGLSSRYRLLRIELPLASRTILAGLKTAAVINVGFATLGGFIGAGGYGDPIFAGIRINDYGIILQGALPAAAMAILVQAFFEIIERICVPRGLRVGRGTVA